MLSIKRKVCSRIIQATFALNLNSESWTCPEIYGAYLLNLDFFVLVFLFTQHKQNLHTIHVHFSNISWPNFKTPDLKFPLHRMAEMFIWTELCWCISLKKRQNKNASSRIILTKYVSWPLRVPDTSSVLEFLVTLPHHQEGFALRPRTLRGRVGLIFRKLNIEWRSQIFRFFWTEKISVVRKIIQTQIQLAEQS